MPGERRSETPVADTKLRAEINVSVLLQGAMLLALSGISGLLYTINEKIGLLASAQMVQAAQIQTNTASINSLRADVRENEQRIRHNEIIVNKFHGGQ